MGDKMEINLSNYNNDVCVCCGNPLPEGLMVCSICKEKISNSSNNNSKNKYIKNTATNKSKRRDGNKLHFKF